MSFIGLKLRISWAVLAMAVLWSLSFPTVSEAWNYRGPFKGCLVDAETLQPIQGAVVFVEWSGEKPTPLQPTRYFYDAAEVLTDEQGYFYIKKKWSLNPWTILVMDSTVIIYKAGYGKVENLLWPRLKMMAEHMHEVSLKEGKRVPPGLEVKIEFEDGLPLFLLKKLTTREERIRNIGFYSIDAPQQKMKLLREEENKERKALGLD